MIDIQKKFSGVEGSPTPCLRALVRAKMGCEIKGWRNAAMMRSILLFQFHRNDREL